MDTSTGSFSATVEGVSGDAVVMLLGELDLDTAPELAATPGCHRVLRPRLHRQLGDRRPRRGSNAPPEPRRTSHAALTEASYLQDICHAGFDRIHEGRS
jgi:hypothetical protein